MQEIMGSTASCRPVKRIFRTQKCSRHTESANDSEVVSSGPTSRRRCPKKIDDSKYLEESKNKIEKMQGEINQSGDKKAKQKIQNKKYSQQSRVNNKVEVIFKNKLIKTKDDRVK